MMRLQYKIRPMAVERKAWLFSDTQSGVNASAVLFSIMLTCRANNVEPYAYQRHVLAELPQREVVVMSVSCCHLVTDPFKSRWVEVHAYI